MPSLSLFGPAAKEKRGLPNAFSVKMAIVAALPQVIEQEREAERRYDPLFKRVDAMLDRFEMPPELLEQGLERATENLRIARERLSKLSDLLKDAGHVRTWEGVEDLLQPLILETQPGLPDLSALMTKRDEALEQRRPQTSVSRNRPTGGIFGKENVVQVFPRREAQSAKRNDKAGSKGENKRPDSGRVVEVQATPSHSGQPDEPQAETSDIEEFEGAGDWSFNALSDNGQEDTPLGRTTEDLRPPQLRGPSDAGQLGASLDPPNFGDRQALDHSEYAESGRAWSETSSEGLFVTDRRSSRPHQRSLHHQPFRDDQNRNVTMGAGGKTCDTTNKRRQTLPGRFPSPLTSLKGARKRDAHGGMSQESLANARPESKNVLLLEERVGSPEPRKRRGRSGSEVAVDDALGAFAGDKSTPKTRKGQEQKGKGKSKAKAKETESGSGVAKKRKLGGTFSLKDLIRSGTIGKGRAK